MNSSTKLENLCEKFPLNQRFLLNQEQARGLYRHLGEKKIKTPFYTYHGGFAASTPLVSTLAVPTLPVERAVALPSGYLFLSDMRVEQRAVRYYNPRRYPTYHYFLDDEFVDKTRAQIKLALSHGNFQLDISFNFPLEMQPKRMEALKPGERYDLLLEMKRGRVTDIAAAIWQENHLWYKQE